MKTTRKDDNRKVMVIGCGHANYRFDDCGFCHPKEEFLTVDQLARLKPDLQFSLPSQDFNNAIQGREFSSIIWEHFPVSSELPTSPLMMREFVENNGNIIYVGVGVNRLKNINAFLVDFDSGVSMFWLKPTTVFPHREGVIFFSIAKQSSTKELIPALQLHKELNTYFNEELSAEQFQYIPIKERIPEFLERGDFLEKLKLEYINGYFQDHEDCILFDESKPSPITLQEIKDIALTYKPGIFRSLFSKDGKTLGMRQLHAYLIEHKNEAVLSAESLYQLLQILSKRGHRLMFNMNPFRSQQGATSEIFKKISLRVLPYLASNEDNRAKFITVCEAEQGKQLGLSKK